jgi:hypothetical protein
VVLGGIRFEAGEVVEEAQCRGVESSECGSDYWNERSFHDQLLDEIQKSEKCEKVCEKRRRLLLDLIH